MSDQQRTVLGSTLYEKYSMAWLETSTIVISTIIGSLFYTISNIKHLMNSSRSRLETVCDLINSTSEQIYSAPMILLNATRTSMFTAKENIQHNLSTAIAILEKCIVWLVQMYKSTYRCLLGLAVHSVLSIVSQIAGPLQKAAQGITSFITGGNLEIGDWTQSLTDTQNKIDEWFKNDDDIIQQMIDTPFQLIQTQINTTLGSWEPPIYNNQQQSDQYSNNCNSAELIQSLNNVEYQLLKYIWIMIGLLFGVLLLCILFNIYLIRFRHNRVVQARAMILRLFRNSTSQGDMLLDRYTWSTSKIIIPWHKRNLALYRFLNFMSHPIAVYCLLVSLVGLVITFSLSYMIETKSQELYQGFSLQTQQWSSAATSQWTTTQQFDQINHWISETELDLNNHAFGIIKSTAITINDTLTNVVNQVQDLIQNVLGGTLLESPAKDLTKCLLFNKIESIEQGLTWVVKKKSCLFICLFIDNFFIY